MAQDFWAERIAQLEAQQRAAQQPPPPMYSPEEVASRVAANKRQEAMGALGVMSGDRPMGALGGTYLKQAMGDRAQKTTASGQIDPLRGNMKYFPQYLQQRQSERTDKSLDRAYEQQNRAADRRELAAGRRSNAQAIAGALSQLGQGPAQVVGYGDDNRQVYRPNKGGPLFQYDTKGQPKAYEGVPYNKAAVPSKISQDISKQTDLVAEHDRILQAFSPKLAGTSGPTGAAEAFFGRYGGPTGQTANYWQNYSNYVIKVRRELFGTALTKPEEESFNKANIEPGMRPEIIQQRLKEQNLSIRRARNKLAQPYLGSKGVELIEEPEVPLPGSIDMPGAGFVNPQSELMQSLPEWMRPNGGQPAPAAATAAPAPRQVLPQANPAGGGWSIRRKD